LAQTLMPKLRESTDFADYQHRLGQKSGCNVPYSKSAESAQSVEKQLSGLPANNANERERGDASDGAVAAVKADLLLSA